MFQDTIFALSSGFGKAAISVYRISGNGCLSIIKSLCNPNQITPRHLYRANIKSRNGDVIDDVMWVYFKAPNSFTGEDLVEIYTHGSIAISKMLIKELSSFPNTRIAEPGEFTKRALLNNKMDLTSAEGLMDLINSETDLQRKQAINQMAGSFYDITEEWRKEILEIMSLVEAFIDFPDEDIPEEVLSDAEEKINKIKKSFESILNDNRKGERMRNGLKLTIFGKPNVGKSSLINFLTKREVSIVSDISGTTRDIIETHIDIGGYPIILVDTAGIRENTEDIIEIEGIKRAKKAIDESDIKIFLQDASDHNLELLDEANVIHVLNKIDISNPNLENHFVKISVKQNIGMDLLIQEIIDTASKIAGNGENIYITQERHRESISNALESLSRANLRSDLVLAAEDLRIASRSLSYLLGRIDSDEILGQIFSSFCIGK